MGYEAAKLAHALMNETKVNRHVIVPYALAMRGSVPSLQTPRPVSSVRSAAHLRGHRVQIIGQ